jgi:hypothetical protein
MIKGIILTNINISDEEKQLINNSKFFKVCVNWADYKCDYRLVKDRSGLRHIKKKYPCDYIYHIGVDLDVYFNIGTIVSAVHFTKRYVNDIIIVGDNTVHKKSFQDGIKQELKAFTNLYQFSKGNFDLPVMDLREFLND